MTVTTSIIKDRVDNIKKKKFLMECTNNNSKYIKHWLENSNCAGIECKKIEVDSLCPVEVKTKRTINNKITIKEISNKCND